MLVGDLNLNFGSQQPQYQRQAIRQGSACASLGALPHRNSTAEDWHAAATAEAAVSLQRLLTGGRGDDAEAASCGMFVLQGVLLEPQTASCWLATSLESASAR